MIGKKIRINCYKAVYEVNVSSVNDKGVYGSYRVLKYNPTARKYKPVYDFSYGMFLWDSTTAIKIIK